MMYSVDLLGAHHTRSLGRHVFNVNLPNEAEGVARKWAHTQVRCSDRLRLTFHGVLEDEARIIRA